MVKFLSLSTTSATPPPLSLQFPFCTWWYYTGYEHLGDPAKRKLSWGMFPLGLEVKNIKEVLSHSCVSYMIASVLVVQWLPGTPDGPWATQVQGKRWHLDTNMHVRVPQQMCVGWLRRKQLWSMQNRKLIYGKFFQSSDLLTDKQRIQISLTHPQNQRFLFIKIFPNLTTILKIYVIWT